MKFYIEISLREDSKINPYELWSRLYGQLHLAMAELKGDNEKSHIGISLPEYRYNASREIGFIGDVIRVFARTQAELESLDLPKWLERLVSNLDMSPICEVPAKVDGYAVYHRKQVKSSLERLARRKAKHTGMNYEDILKDYATKQAQTTNLPFIQLKSLTSEQRFKLFIERIEQDQASATYDFTSYGLSAGSTVPEF